MNIMHVFHTYTDTFACLYEVFNVLHNKIISMKKNW